MSRQPESSAEEPSPTAATAARSWWVFWGATLASPRAALWMARTFRDEMKNNPALRMRMLALRGGMTVTSLSVVLAATYIVTLPLAAALLGVVGIGLAVGVGASVLTRGALHVMRGIADIFGQIYDAAVEDGGVLAPGSPATDKTRQRAVLLQARRQKLQKTWRGRARMRLARGFVFVVVRARGAVLSAGARADAMGQSLRARPAVARMVRSDRWQRIKEFTIRRQPVLLTAAAGAGAVSMMGVGAWALLAAKASSLPVLAMAAAVSALSVVGVFFVASGIFSLYQVARTSWNWSRQGKPTESLHSVAPSSLPVGARSDFSRVAQPAAGAEEAGTMPNSKQPPPAPQ